MLDGSILGENRGDLRRILRRLYGETLFSSTNSRYVLTPSGSLQKCGFCDSPAFSSQQRSLLNAPGGSCPVLTAPSCSRSPLLGQNRRPLLDPGGDRVPSH